MMEKDVNINISLTNRKTGESTTTSVLLIADDLKESKSQKQETKIRKAVLDAVKDILNKTNITLLSEDKKTEGEN